MAAKTVIRIWDVFLPHPPANTRRLERVMEREMASATGEGRSPPQLLYH
jgi:hypothetical protein